MRLKVWQKWILGAGCGCTSLLIALALFLYIPFALDLINGPPQRPADQPPVVTLPVGEATESAPPAQESPSNAESPTPTPTEEKSILPLNPLSNFTDIELSPYAYITGIRRRSVEIFEAGQRLGNHPNVFSKVGDSITVTNAFLVPFSQGYYTLGEYAYLQTTLDYFLTGVARTGNPFANESLVAKNGWRASSVLSTENTNPQVCPPDELPLICEYRLTRPAIALIMFGTNDVIPTPPQNFEQDLRGVIDISIQMGVIPVLSTIPEYKQVNMRQEVAELNGIITALAQAYEIPLWDYHLTLAGLPNQGIGEDGVHPSVSYAHPAQFTGEYLDLGMTIRNLTALQVLDALYWAIIQPNTE